MANAVEDLLGSKEARETQRAGFRDVEPVQAVAPAAQAVDESHLTFVRQRTGSATGADAERAAEHGVSTFTHS